jgi:hypothetical protein
VCTLLVDDRDDMVVKALSWALRSLVDPDAMRCATSWTATTGGCRPVWSAR